MKSLAGLVLILVGGLAGCGGPGGVTVEGTVSFMDGSPLPRGVVSITGDAGAFQGAIAADGKYKIENVASGTYGVAITGAMDGEPDLSMNYDEEGNFAEKEAQEPKSLIDAAYGDPTGSGLKLEVPGGDYNIKVNRPSS